MDPFTIATGVFACLTTAEILTKCSKSLYRSGRRVKGAKGDITKFASDVGLFSSIIEVAFIALEPYTAISDNENPPVLQYLIKHQVLTSLFEQSKRVTDEIYSYVPIIRNPRGRSELLVSLKWVFRKKDVEAIVPKMDSVKCNLLVVMHSISIEAMRSRPRTPVGDREMKVQTSQLLCGLC